MSRCFELDPNNHNCTHTSNKPTSVETNVRDFLYSVFSQQPIHSDRFIESFIRDDRQEIEIIRLIL